MAWHPADTLLPTVWVLPGPGTKDPFAEIRWLQVSLGDNRVWRFRAVTWAEPRRLIGYYEQLGDAAAAAYKIGLGTLTPASNFGLYDNTPNRQS